jgi:hypothetical protein
MCLVRFCLNLTDPFFLSIHCNTYRGFKRYSGGPSMPDGWVVFRHGLFSQNRPELASKMCTGKNRHSVVKEAKEQAKPNSAYQGTVAAPRYDGFAAAAAAAAATSTSAMRNSSDSFVKMGILNRQAHSASVLDLASLSGNQLQTVQLIKMQLDEAINIERMKLQQRLQGHAASSLLQRDFLTPMDTAITSRLMALHRQAETRRGASGMYSAAGTAPRLHGYESLLLEQQAAQTRTSCLSSLPHRYEHDSLLGNQEQILEQYRFGALREQLTARETQLRLQLQEKEIRLLNKQRTSSPPVPQEVNVTAGRPAITDAERLRLLRLREQLDFVIGM